MLKETIAFFAVICVFLFAGCSTNSRDDATYSEETDGFLANLVGASENLPFGELDDPHVEDYDVVLQDEDGWLLELNQTIDGISVQYYTGRIYIDDAHCGDAGSAYAVYSTLLDMLTFYGEINIFSHTAVSYSINFNNDDIEAVWMYTDNGHGETVAMNVFYGSIGNHEAVMYLDGPVRQPVKIKDRGPIQETSS